MAHHGKLRLPSASTLQIRLSVGGDLDRLLLADAVERLAMIAQAQGADAGLRHLVHALPEREAVWLACMCVPHTAPASIPDGDVGAVRIAGQRVPRPDATERRSMLPVLRAADPDGPAAALLRGAIASRPARPDNLGVGLSVSRAVMHAAGLSSDQERAAVRQRSRASALDIAAGGGGWIDPGAASPTGGERVQP